MPAIRSSQNGNYALASSVPRPNMAGGRVPLASKLAGGGSTQPPQNAPYTFQSEHTTTTGGADWRLQYGAPLVSESDGATNPVSVKVGFVYPLVRVDTVGTTSGSNVVTDPSITSADTGRSVTGAGIPANSFVGTVTPGVQFLLSSSATAQSGVNATATASGVAATLAPVVTPVTWQGKQSCTWEPGGTTQVCDPIPVDVPAGGTFRLRQWVSTLFGQYKTVATATAVNDTAIVLNAAPALAFTNALPQTITVGSEQVTATAWNAGTLTLTVTAMTATHAIGVVVGQQTISNTVLFSDQGGAATAGATDNSWTTTTLGALSANATTLTSAAAAGDKFIKVAAPMPGASWTVDTVGSGVQETVTVVNVVGESNPYTAWLAAPLVNSHSSGVAVTAAVNSQSGIIPTTITCDRPLTTPPPAIYLGPSDSIVNGTGYNMRSGSSYLIDALEQKGRPYVNASKSGEALFQWVSMAQSRRRRTLMSLCGWAYFEQVTNDLYGSASLATTQANLLAAVALAKSRGLKVAVQTCIPRTTSTDAFATTANQTIVTSGAGNVGRLAFNAWVMSGATGADLVIPMHQALDSGLATGGAETSKWLAADVDLGAYTASGLHPSKLGHDTMKAFLISGGYIDQMV